MKIVKITIDEYRDEDVEEPYIIKERDKVANTKWSLAKHSF